GSARRSPPPRPGTGCRTYGRSGLSNTVHNKQLLTGTERFRTRNCFEYAAGVVNTRVNLGSSGVTECFRTIRKACSAVLTHERTGNRRSFNLKGQQKDNRGGSLTKIAAARSRGFSVADP